LYRLLSNWGGYRPENVTTGITGANLAPPYPRNSQQAPLMMVIDAWKKAADDRGRSD
jgi:hypothetical protein